MHFFNWPGGRCDSLCFWAERKVNAHRITYGTYRCMNNEHTYLYIYICITEWMLWVNELKCCAYWISLMHILSGFEYICVFFLPLRTLSYIIWAWCATIGKTQTPLFIVILCRCDFHCLIEFRIPGTVRA